MTMHKFLTVGLIATLAVLSAAQAQEQDPNKKKEVRKTVLKEQVSSRAYPLSNKRKKQIKDVVTLYLDRNEKLDDSSVQDSIYDDVSKFVVLEPKEAADLRTFDEFQKEIKPQVDKKFPLDNEAVRKDAEKRSEEKFTMHKPKDKVKVFYKRGSSTYSVSGSFYGYGYGGRSIQVNDRHVAMFDLIPESRIKFDKAYNEKAREEFIAREMQNYLNKKYAFSNELYRKAQQEQRSRNEKNGYIYSERKWNTAKQLTDAAIEEAKIVAEQRAKEAREKALEDAKKNVGQAADALSLEKPIEKLQEKYAQ